MESPAEDATAAPLERLVQLLLDPVYYLAVNRDIGQVKREHPEFDVVGHFVNYGMAEGRVFSLEFDIPYVQHHLSRTERLQISPGAAFRYFASLPAAQRFVPNRWFSPWAFRRLYAARYPELADMSDYETFTLYLEHQSYAALSPNGLFNEEAYRLRYRDVAVAIGEGALRSGFRHFIATGATDPRSNLPGLLPAPEPDYDPRALEINLICGQIWLPKFVWWYDEGFYLSVYPDVHDLVRREIVKSGLEHFIVAGFHEGRLPCPALFRHLLAPAEADPWEFFAALPAPAKDFTGEVSIREACAILRQLDGQPGAASRRKLTDALWPFVTPPALGGQFDAKHYLAVNVDVARSLGQARPEAEAEAHFRNFGFKEQRIAPGTNLFSDRTIAFRDVLGWKSGVNFFGPASAASGLGSAARGYIAALRAAGVAVDVYDTSYLINTKLPADLFCAEDLAYSINFICLNADQVMAFASKYGTEIFNHRANVGAWVWELPSPRLEWRTILSAFDLIITPSAYCTESFALFTDCPVRTVPYVVDQAALLAARDAAGRNFWIERIEAEKRTGKKIILFIMDASSYRARKGVDIFCELAARVDAAAPGKFLFVLKYHSKDISLARTDPYGPAVLSVEAMFNFADLCRLKSIADLYVSPHRSEGFGLNIIESILLGVPVLCSDYAGGTDLLADNDPPLVPVALREIGRTMGPYAAAAVWAEPDIEAMQSRLLAYFKKPRSEKKFAEMRQRLAGLLSAASVGAGLKRQFEKFCAFGAESSQNRLEIFRAMAGLRHDECLRFDYVKELSRRSPDSPGLDRLGEITMAAVNPDFAIITPVLQLEQGDVETIFDDLISQSYPAWEWCIVADDSTAPALQAALRALRQRDARIKLRIGPGLATAAAAINAGAAISQAPYIIVAGAAGRLSINMLAHYCGHIREHAVTGIIYPDEDAAGGATFFKPDWSPELLLGGNYIGNGFCVRKAEFLKLGGYREAFDGAHDYDFLLRAAAAHLPVQHLDTILFHRRLNGAGAAADSRGQSALADYLKTIGIEAKVDPGLLPATYRPRPRLPASRVALNILTGAARRREPPGAGAALLEALPPELAGTYAAGFVASILAQPPDVDFEIRVVADQAVASLMAPLAALDQRVSIIPFARAGQTFNFAEMANFALAGAAADRLVLLNDDMEALDEDWLPALLEMLELPGAGIIGGQLLHDEGLVQHSGIVLGVHGATAHLFEGIGATDPGYNGYNLTIRNYAAVTGAMMALHRATLERAGGFDIEFPVDYNDVDFCLRVGELGLRTIYTPFARLRHFESRSARRLFVDGFDKQKFIGRWARVIEHDPYYNRNLTRHGVQCELKS